MNKQFAAVFTPFTVKNLTLKNRIVLPPMATRYPTTSGEVTPRLIAYHRERAAGGVGLNILEFTGPDARRRPPHQAGIYDDALIPGLAALVKAVHEAGGKIAIQLAHPGRRTRSAMTHGLRPWAPSAIPELGGEVPYEMSQSQIDYMEDCFMQAARRAKQAGFDAIEIHCAHGYLIHQFFSPLTNRRTDKYGGSFENRARFALEILARAREAVGDEFPIFCRISGDEFVEGGATLADWKEFAKLLEKAGADIIHVSAGVLESTERTIPPQAQPRGCNIGLAAAIKQSVNIPVIGVGRIKTLQEADALLREKKVDLVAMGRALIADPELLKKAQVGGNIRPCIACNQGCIDRLYAGLAITCVVNARTGREYELRSLERAPVSKKIAVIGGGPGGMEFARVAAERGHKITLFEKEAELGGKFRIAAIAPKKGEINEFVQYQTRALKELGVEIKTGAAIAPEDLSKLSDFDEIVIAAGGDPIRLPATEGQSNVSLAEDVLENKVVLGSKVVVVGGGMVGCETADWLAQSGRQVIILEQLPQFATDVEVRTRKMLLQRLAAQKVDMICNAKAERFNQDKVVCSQVGVEFTIEGVDNIVLALGYKPNGAFSQAQSPKIHKLGDCVEPRKAMAAIHEGFLLGTRI
jgi:2,4-dienoyl-CoA reductase-like NADH-dependent reductase (Old Yellow Enzyme family)/NADPH-dependent glutamate synthase beta subunit-like oxidoreductase